MPFSRTFYQYDCYVAVRPSHIWHERKPAGQLLHSQHFYMFIILGKYFKDIPQNKHFHSTRFKTFKGFQALMTALFKYRVARETLVLKRSQ